MMLTYGSSDKLSYSVLKIIQHFYLILLLPIFALAVNPAGLADALPPGTSYYIYTLWPKISILAALFCTGLLGCFASYFYDKVAFRKTLRTNRMLCILILVFLITYSASALYEYKNYLTSFEVWHGEIIHGDGLIFTIMWWMLIPLGILTFRVSTVKKKFLYGLIVFTFLMSSAWALCNHLGFEPARLINPTLLNNGINAGFGNRAWAGFIFSIFFVIFFFRNLRSVLSFGWLILSGLATSSIIMTGGRMGLINMLLTVLGAVIFILYRRTPIRFILWPTLIVVTFGIMSYGVGLGVSSRLSGLVKFQTDGGFTHRIIPWKAGLREIRKSPFLGNHSDPTRDIIWANLTPNETKELLTEFAPREAIFGGKYTFSDGSLVVFDDETKEANVSSVAFSRFHNQYIELGVRGGIFLVLIYLSLLYYIIKTLLLRNEITSYLMGIITLFYAIYNIVWFTGPVVEPFTLALIGLGLALRIPDEKGSISKF